MKRFFSIGILLLSLSLIPQLAMAQSTTERPTRTTTTTETTVFFGPGWFLLAISPYTSSTTTTGITTAGIVGMTMSTVRLLLPRGRACPQAVAYLRNNHRSLQDDLLLGGGPSIDELAFLMEVPDEHHQDFARILRENRESLLPYLHPELDEEDATAFLTGVLELWG